MLHTSQRSVGYSYRACQKRTALLSHSKLTSRKIRTQPFSIMAAKTEDKKPDIMDVPTKNGTFDRQISSFRSWISSKPGAEFPPEKDRYV